MPDIKLGYRVRLRSGGPLMTVHAISGENIDCQWFTLKGELRSSTFPSYMLTVIEGAAADAG
ncbi:DUF2158 domain-containing protein [Bradyrhizobium diazoefficiens]|uniref:DUF2158 domain-containing protein n=1 Tax=Bradyrhizobium tunisiense TaxID=3278709 RepID=UPI001BAD0DAE|nr:DUF2158 domain-containing protein [Bradyrhizobium diazoefficiens]MBR0813079.1 DUF2158 domain-containing protein [Bradyrhizobium diazoefficiens]